ncbi:isochorismate synthase [Subsaximicrobium wynnwilliamsii]|uniref:Isochorismate synthase n=1 Tax=Subsaximicrobium wynnwilliamsii TaxID=291179 RepID=A0A5C6ZKC5_9FLAO|nr:chorismate-binding protein [Subsaximicrobium wynnwilliamsii]TXD84163.1 isochorismate synthase [Subsaximicrobium wynnwilliamsii]TXD89784.1 isochorismate synthase [Subsaximicrobium wynnwilliamsii]TXE03875.1 isochorismate synthase [Subsaximicrobium wynnwilliamsii]
MTKDELLKSVQAHWISNLPFVAYSKPDTALVNAVLQKSDQIHYTLDFEESGFVFAPFNNQEETIIFPSENSKLLKADFVVEAIAENTKADSTLGDETETSAQKQHKVLVEKAISAIADNKFKKVVISREEVLPIDEQSPFTLFENLLQCYPSAMVYIWFHPKVGLWLGATPETLLQVEGLRFKTMALAGTQAYIDTEAVVWDAKNIMEQQLVTNFIEDQLQPVVATLNIMDAETIKAGRLLHLRSHISGILKSDGNKLKHLLQALHPTPAVCGLPKSEAKAFILKNENYNREFYAGFLGELNLSKTTSRNPNRRNVENNAYASITKLSHLYVNLRCMQIKQQNAHLYVGGGITQSSNPEAEWEETVNKLQTMKRVLG